MRGGIRVRAGDGVIIDKLAVVAQRMKGVGLVVVVVFGVKVCVVCLFLGGAAVAGVCDQPVALSTQATVPLADFVVVDFLACRVVHGWTAWRS